MSKEIRPGANLWKANLSRANLEGAKISVKYKDLIDWVEE